MQQTVKHRPRRLTAVRTRKLWLGMIACALPVIAAPKQRDWQTGQVIEARTEQATQAWGSILNQRTALVQRQVYAIASADKDYLIVGLESLHKGQLTAGMTVSFAVEGRTMFISIAGKEHR